MNTVKSKDLKWDDSVKKTFLVTVLTQHSWALIVISISVLYDEYIILLQWVSHNLNSIQKTVTQECHMTTTIITQQSHTDNMNWELTKHIIVTATKTEERHRAQWVSEKKVMKHHMKQLCMHCRRQQSLHKELQTSVCCTILNYQCCCSWDCERK
jgi:hypothetical protein